jgi:type II secretory pathway component PulK
VKRQRGGSLVVTLAVLAGLVALIGVLSSSQSESMRAQTNRMAMRRAQLMAEAGIQRAISEILNRSKGPTTLNQSWATLGQAGATEIKVGADSFRLQVMDAGSCINLNTADQATLSKLPMTPDQVASLMDWREKTATPRSGGAKDSYYNGLIKPYNTKLQPFGSIDELLQVKGFTPSTVYGGGKSSLDAAVTIDSSSNDLDPDGNQKVDIALATVTQLIGLGVSPQSASAVIQSQGSFSTMGAVLKVQGLDQSSAKIILNYFQVQPGKPVAGLINVNTASQSVLSALPGMESDIVSAILSRQSNGFEGLGDLVDVPGLGLTTLAAVIDKFSTSSLAFEVRSLGSAAGLTAGLEAAITVDSKGNVTVLREQPAPFKNPSDQWGWPERATDQIALVGAW